MDGPYIGVRKSTYDMLWHAQRFNGEWDRVSKEEARNIVNLLLSDEYDGRSGVYLERWTTYSADARKAVLAQENANATS
jgi:hypothetical protein